jgi:hypothetical protein
MSTAVLQAVSKVFTSEVIDLFLKEGLVDYYEVVSSFVKDETATDDELSRNERTMNALTIVIEDFMTPDEFKQWLKERT